MLPVEDYRDHYGSKTKMENENYMAFILSNVLTYSILLKVTTKLMLTQIIHRPNFQSCQKPQAHTLLLPTLTNKFNVLFSIQDT